MATALTYKILEELLLKQRQSHASPLSAIRTRAFERFSRLGLPTSGSEDFQYVAAVKIEKLQGSGYCLDKAELPTPLIALPLEEAFRSYGAYLDKIYTEAVAKESDPMALLALALHEQASFLYLPPGVQLEVPLRWIRSVGGFSHLHIRLGAGAALTLLSSGDGEGFSSSLSLAVLDEGATLTHIDLQLASSGQHFGAWRALLKQGAQIQSIGIAAGGGMQRRSVVVALRGERAEARIQGLSILTGKAQAHNHIALLHEAPHTHSHQLFKAVLGGSSRSSFQGKIIVSRAAQKTEAYQLSKALLLSDGAIAYAKPGLEILADDVKASHGATVSELSKEILFYLRSRGLSSAAAQRLLIEGFCREISDAIAPLDVRAMVEQLYESL